MTQCYSTDALPPATRIAAWNALYSRELANVEITPGGGGDYAARLSLGRLGPIRFARMTTSRMHIQRTRRHILPGAPRLYSFLLQARGRGILSHCGQEAQLNEGDFALCDSAAPHSFAVEDGSMVVMVRVDAPTLRTYLPSPERFCGLHLQSQVGLTASLSPLVERISGQLERGFTCVYDDRLARNLMEMLALSYAIGFDLQPDATAVVRARHAEVVRYVEDHLRDPQLSPATVAAGLRISPRYLRTIFASTGEKASAYIIRRRLEECGRQLRDPAWAGHTLTEIAFSWGFNSAAHFTRTFHEQFGVPPREYRRGAQG
jgi:AraC-like DNA-binding protein